MGRKPGSKWSPEQRARCAILMNEKRKTNPEYFAALSKRMSEMCKNPEFTAKRMSRLREVYKTKEYREAISSATAKNWKNDEYRKEHLGYLLSDEAVLKRIVNTSGPKSQFWKDGRHRSHGAERKLQSKTKRCKLLYKSALARDVTCRCCGGSKHLQAHHIQGWFERPDLRYDINNVKLLCGRCHGRLHYLEGHGAHLLWSSAGYEFTSSNLGNVEPRF